MTSHSSYEAVLLIGTPRGLGHAIAVEYIERGSVVVATVRGTGRTTELHELQETADDRLEIKHAERGGFELYRASRSAFNQLMRTYAARYHDGESRLLLIAPCWVKTGLGGPNARLDISESIPASSRPPTPTRPQRPALPRPPWPDSPMVSGHRRLHSTLLRPMPTEGRSL